MREIILDDELSSNDSSSSRRLSASDEPTRLPNLPERFTFGLHGHPIQWFRSRSGTLRLVHSVIVHATRLQRCDLRHRTSETVS